MYTREQIADLADDYALTYITAHTDIPLDSPKSRVLVKAFEDMALEVIGKMKESLIGLFKEQE